MRRASPVPSPADRFARSFWAGIAILLAAAGSVHSHEIPDERVDRSIELVVEPGRLVIDYEVSLSEWTALLDLRRLDEAAGEARLGTDARERYGRLVAPLHSRALLASVDDSPLEFEVISVEVRAEDHLVYRFTFEAGLPAAGRLRFRDANYLESTGTSRLDLRVHPGIRLGGGAEGIPLPDREARPRWMQSDEEERASRAIEFDYATVAAADPFVSRGTSREAPPTPATAPLDLAARLRGMLAGEGGPPILLALGLATLLGVAHALQPGHGKLLVAAASAGQGGSAGRAVGLAAVVSAAHLASVVGLGIFLWVSRGYRFAEIDQGMRLAAGSLLAVQGAYRLGRSLSGSRSGSTGEARGAGPRRREGWLAAIGVGLLPCWDALLLLLLAEAHGRLALGLLLVAGFSLGLLVVQFVVALGSGRLGGLAASGPARVLRLVGGAALLGLGLAIVLN